MFDSSLIFLFVCFDEIDSIDVIVWVTDVCFFTTDDSSKLVSIIDDSAISILNDDVDKVILVSIISSVVFLDSNVNEKMNISNFLYEKDDFKNFTILEFLNSSSSKNRFTSESFFFDLMLNRLNSFHVFSSSSRALSVYFSFSVISSESTHLDNQLTVLRDWLSRSFVQSLFFVIYFTYLTVLRDSSSYLFVLDYLWHLTVANWSSLKSLMIAISQYHLSYINEQIDSIFRTSALVTFNSKDLKWRETFDLTKLSYKKKKERRNRLERLFIKKLLESDSCSFVTWFLPCFLAPLGPSHAPSYFHPYNANAKRIFSNRIRLLWSEILHRRVSIDWWTFDVSVMIKSLLIRSLSSLR
jgi:hypothetical protein